MIFVRNVEDFVCEHCGESVKGTGYTNHCPKCLWSKHVDVDPGDRAATCGGMMKPIRVEGKTGEYVLVHRCEQCTFERRNKVSDIDDVGAVIALAEAQAR
jgi:hypothetical protein